MDQQQSMTFLSKNKNDKLVTLRISRSVDPFAQKNFRYINRKLHMTVGITAPITNPDEWIEVTSFEDAECQAVKMAASLEPDFDINLNSRRARDVLAAMGNRVATLSTRGNATNYIVHPSFEDKLCSLLKSSNRASVYSNINCPDDRLIAVFKNSMQTSTIDGAFHYMYDKTQDKHWLCMFQGTPMDITWKHYVSVARIVDDADDDDEDLYID